MATKENTLAKKSSGSVMRYVNIIITIALMFGFGMLPPFATLTPVGMKLIGVFLGVIYGYSTCEIVWPSLLAMVAFGISGYTTMSAGIASMLGHPVVFQVLTQYFVAGAIIVYGFGKWFVRWSLSQKMFKGKPKFYTWCFMFIFMFACLILNDLPLSLLLYAVWNDIADSCGYDKNSSFRYYGFCGIMVSLILGSGMIPYRSWLLGLSVSWKEIFGVQINMGIMFLLTAIIGILFVTIYVYLGAKVFKVDFSIMQEFDVEKLGDESKQRSHRMKRILGVFVFSMLVSIYAGTFTSATASFLNDTLTMGGLYCLIAVFLMVLPSGDGDGKACIIFNDIKHSDAAISWPVIFMVATTIPLATALSNEVTGVMPWLTGLFAPVFEGRGPVFIVIFTIVVMFILTNVGSNIAFGTAMIPVIAPFVLASGMNPVLPGAALLFMANLGILLPGASAPASIFHGRSELPNAAMRTKVVAFAAGIAVTLTIIVFGIAAIFLG